MVSQSIAGNAQRSAISHWLVLVVGVGIVLSGGMLYGHYSQRWGPPADLVAAGSHLESFPRQIGKWQLVEEFPMGDSTLEMLECAGYVNRRYVSQETGKTVNIAVIVGPPGPTAVHTPEICYSSRAYELQDQRRVVVIDSDADGEHSFWNVNFKTRDVLADELCVYYAWSRGERWEASKSPRVEFAAAPLLYKMQISGFVTPATRTVDSDPCHQFLDDLLNTEWSLKAKKNIAPYENQEIQVRATITYHISLGR